jgi:hypothetical protein
MENKLKFRSGILLATVAFGLLFSACSDDDDDYYSIGDFIVSFGVIDKTGTSADDNSFVILLDNGDKVAPVSSSHYIHDLNDNQRVWVNFNPLDDKENDDNTKTYYANIMDMRTILYKNISKMAEVSDDSMGHDPVIIKDSWISGDSILNVEFKYYTQGSVHYINLLDINEGNGVDQPYIYEFRHNARGDEKNYLVSGFVSFKLNPIKLPSQNKVEFYIRYTDYDGKRIDIPHTFNY